MKTYLKITLGVLAGAVAGYVYYYFWGCKNGCPLTSTWYIPTLYGSVFGLIAVFPGRKKARAGSDEKEEDR